MTRKLRQALQNSSINLREPEEISGLLGLKIGGGERIDVPGRQGFVYIRLRDALSEVIQARNGVVSNTYDLPVIVVRSGNAWRIKGRDTERYSSWGNTSSYLPVHGLTHELDRELGIVGSDPIFLSSEQVTPLLITPNSVTGSMTLSIHPYIEELTSGSFAHIGNLNTINFTPYVPMDANAIMGLVYNNPTDGSFGYLFNTGTPFSASITGSSAIDDYIPRLTNSTYNPLVAVRLVSGTTSLGWDNLYDVRQWFGGRGGNSTGTVTSITIQDDGVAQGTVQTINFVGDNMGASVSGTVARIFVTGSSGGAPGGADTDIQFNDAGTFGGTSDFTYDKVDNILSIGSGLDKIPGGNRVHFYGDGAAPPRIAVYGYNDTLTSEIPGLTGIKGGGTKDAPTQTKINTELIQIVGLGYDDTNTLQPTQAKLTFVADQDFTSTSRSTRMDVELTQNGSTGTTSAISVYADGSIYNNILGEQFITLLDVPESTIFADAPLTGDGGFADHLAIPAATSLVDGYATATQIAKLDGIEAGAQVNNVGGDIHAAAAASLADADEVGFWQSVGGALKKITWANIWAAIQTRLGTLNLFFSGGNVGVGGTPLSKFQVNGTIRVVSDADKFLLYEDDVATTDGFIRLSNATGTAGKLLPMFWWKSNITGGTQASLFISDCLTDAAGEGAAMQFSARLNNAGVISNRLAFQWTNYTTHLLALAATGSVGIKTATFPSGGGTPVLALGQATGNPTGVGANTAGLIVKDSGGTAELYAWDEAGNVTLLSPHAADAPAWMYDALPGMEIVHKSENLYTGKIEWTNDTRRNALMQSMVNGDVLSDGNKKIFHLIETYAEYNARTGQDLQVQDWDANQEYWRVRRESEIADWQKNKTAYDIALAAWEKLSAKKKAKTDPPAVPGVCPESYVKKDKPKWMS